MREGMVALYIEGDAGSSVTGLDGLVHHTRYVFISVFTLVVEYVGIVVLTSRQLQADSYGIVEVVFFRIEEPVAYADSYVGQTGGSSFVSFAQSIGRVSAVFVHGRTVVKYERQDQVTVEPVRYAVVEGEVQKSGTVNHLSAVSNSVGFLFMASEVAQGLEMAVAQLGVEFAFSKIDGAAEATSANRIAANGDAALAE